MLRRDELEIQLGIDTADAMVLADPDGVWAALLEVLDGRYRLTELAGLAPQLGISAEQLDSFVQTLAAAGLLQLPQSAGLADLGVRLVGLGPAGTRIGEQLLQAGLGRLIVVDPDTSSTWGSASWGDWTASRDRVQVADHWSKPEVEAADLTIVVTSSLEVDRAVTAGLTQADHPHLLVRPRAGGAIVGPLVVPGHTSCLRCGDLARTRSDPAWPRMLAQLCRTSIRWDPLAADWVAAQATTQALAHLAGRSVETASATLELGPVDWTWHRRVWPADPACGCCWSARAEW